MTITSDESVLGGEPRIEGTRIAVRHIAGRVVDGDRSPAYVADQFDIPPASVYYSQDLPDDDPEGLARTIDKVLEQSGTAELTNELVELDEWYDWLHD